MLFNSLDFWLFLPFCLLVYWCFLGQQVRMQNYFLLGMSYFFYAFWDYRFLFLILLSTAIDYLVGIQLSKPETLNRKRWLAVSILANLFILFTFKYYNFFIESFSMIMYSINIQFDVRTLEVVLPVGISFYTFQSMSYSIDVYRGQCSAVRHFPSFALFVAFFPQLMAGPIERAGDLLPQLACKKEFDVAQFQRGFRRFLTGMVKKVGISPIFLEVADSVYMNPDFYQSGLDLWFYGLLWFIHILMDFSGYTDMAIGIGMMLGIRLSENFDEVFRTQNFRDFWRRWHITLGHWFRDYFFIPVSKKSNKYIAGFLTFLLIGLWHGADAGFLLWGSGLGLIWVLEMRFDVFHHLTKRLRHTTQSAANTLLFFIVFLPLSQLWPSHTVEDALTLVKTMFSSLSLSDVRFMNEIDSSLCFAFFLFIALEMLANPDRVNKLNAISVYSFIRSYVFVPLGVIICFEGLWGSVEFEYFQF